MQRELQKREYMRKEKEETLDIRTVCECNRCLGAQTLHPQVALINLECPGLAQEAVKFEFYAVLLIEECPDGCRCCGRRYYDYDNATMVFLTPGEMFRMSGANALPDKGWLLVFDPALLPRTLSKGCIGGYTFFGYGKDEALHLSCRETASVTCCLENIEEELHHPVDGYTSTILSRRIGLLLDYCSRYYERQFITREDIHKALLSRFSQAVEAYVSAGRLQHAPMPQPSDFAPQLGLSAAYLCDLLRFETGQTFSAYVRSKQLHVAKHLLASTNDPLAAVAQRVGFPSVQHFASLFKKVAGVSPTEYRCLRN